MTPGGRQATLDIVMKAGEKLSKGPPAHTTISLQSFACLAFSAAAMIFVRSEAVRSSEIMLFVLAGSTMRAVAKESRRCRKTFQTLSDNVPEYDPERALMTVNSR